MEEANFSQLREKINSWDIEAEEMLIQKVKFFTLKYNDEFQSICKNFDNFSNSLSSVEFEHLKAINQLKNLSSERFVEQSLDKTETKPQESDIKENILISEPEKIKKSLEIAFPFLDTLSKKNKKEVIEDDTVSVQSSKITMDKNAKGVKLPHIIGTEMFKADKAIGLDVPPDEEEEKDKEEDEDDDELDPELNEFMSDLTVSEKQKAKWEKIKQKKAKQKQKMKEKLKKQKTQNNQQNIQPEKEQEVKVPIENEEEPKKQEDNNVQNEPKAQKVQESDNIKIVANSGGSIPPPPPPPPKPVFTGVKKPPKKQEPKKVVQNPIAQTSVIPPNPAIENPLNPNIPSENSQPNPIPEVKPPVVNKPMSFEEQLRNRIMGRGKGNTNATANTNNNTIENNNLNNTNNNDNSNPTNTSNSLMSNIQTSADNKNPLAPVIHNKNVIVTKQSIKWNNFIGGALDDGDDDDDIDIKASIFNHQKKVSQNKPIIMNEPPKLEPIQNQISKNIPPVIKEEPQEEEPKPIANQNIQPPKQVIPQMFKPPETQFIKIKENENLKKAGSKMKSIFESDDEEESKPNNIVDKTKNLTLKLSTFGIVSNPPPANIQKNDEIKPKPKASFFNDDDDDDNNKKEVKNDIPKVNDIIPTNNNINKNPVSQQPPKKPKISFFDDNDNNEEPQKKIIENKPVPPPQKKQPDFLAGLKEKLMQNSMNQIPMKKPEPKVEEKPPQIEEPKKEEIKVEEPRKEDKNDLPVSLTMKEGNIKPQMPQSKAAKNSYLRFSSMLASKLGQGMMLGGPKPKVEEERKTDYIVPPTNVEATYEEVIEAKKTKVVKKKKPKRTGTFGTGELIPIKKKNPPPEEPIKENLEENEQEQKKEEPKLEELKQEEIKAEEPKVEEVKVEEVKVEQPKQEEIKIEEPEKKENNEPSVPEPQENKDKLNEVKNSIFMLFTDNKGKDEPKKMNLFEKVDLEAQPEVKETKPPVQNNKIDLFSNNAPKEVQKSKLFFLDDDNDDKPPTNKINKMFGEQSEKNANDNKIKVQLQPAKKKLAFFDDDD